MKLQYAYKNHKNKGFCTQFTFFVFRYPLHDYLTYARVDGLVQDYNIATANALEILQSCAKSSG